ncbi:MAG: hypothetical protein ABI675_14960 [Chitinophagaceae bacterium]
MESIEKELRSRMGTGPFLNNHKVSFETYTNGTAHIAAYFPGYDNFSPIVLEIALPGSIPDVIKLLSLKSIADIETITYTRLLEFYFEGNAEIFCLVDGQQILFLNYSKKGNRLFATEEDGTQHEVPENLKTADDFIRHAKRFFGI